VIAGHLTWPHRYQRKLSHAKFDSQIDQLTAIVALEVELGLELATQGTEHANVVRTCVAVVGSPMQRQSRRAIVQA
jgi:hypothetical protein